MRFQVLAKGDTRGHTLPESRIDEVLEDSSISKEEAEKIVAFEARQNIPYPIGEVAWDDSVDSRG